MDIGRRIRIARNAIGYSLKQVEQETGIGQSSLSDFEHSKREPKFSQLSSLADVFRKPIEFFLTEKLPTEDIMLWRDPPPHDQEAKKTEAEFRQLCQHYHKLEVLLEEVRRVQLPNSEVKRAEDFDYRQAERLAEKTQRDFLLGDIPSTSLRQTLEEKFYVKIFHLNFRGSAISIKSPEFNYAILLNKNDKLWRRNFDLAHELFHLLTWDLFRQDGAAKNQHSDIEEKFANAFASKLLLPTDSVRYKIEERGQEGKVSFEALDEVAREFGVSLEALLWRMLYLYNKQVPEIEKDIERAGKLKENRPSRKSDEPDKLPERYCTLAIRALNEGKLSMMQFAKYMGLSYKKAQKYLTEDEDFRDEKISIVVA